MIFHNFTAYQIWNFYLFMFLVNIVVPLETDITTDIFQEQKATAGLGLHQLNQAAF